MEKIVKNTDTGTMPAVSDHLKSVSDDTKRMLKVRFEEVLVPNTIKNKYLTGSFYRVFVQFKVRCDTKKKCQISNSHRTS